MDDEYSKLVLLTSSDTLLMGRVSLHQIKSDIVYILNVVDGFNGISRILRAPLWS